MSHLRIAALRHDLGATIFRIAITQDNSEISSLLLEQLRELAMKYPEGCIQRMEIDKLIARREKQS